ncbi:MAG: hypothetical protein Q9225_001853 [Loekoesia sp. 1 TL-2023]
MPDQNAGLSQLDPTALRSISSGKPPKGVTVDFDAANRWEKTVDVVTSVFMALAIISVGIRAYTKSRILGRGTWDDLTCAFGLLDYILYWLDSVPYIFIKLTFFILYWSVFKPFHALKISILIGGIIVTSVYVGMTIARLVDATPRARETWLEHVKCQICTDLGIPIRLKPVGNTSIVELCIGICITCVPTTSKFLRHILPPENRLASTFEFYWQKLRLYGSTARTERRHKGKAKGIAGRYRNLSSHRPPTKEHDYTLALCAQPGITTEITAQSPAKVKGSGIEVEVELEQYRFDMDSISSVPAGMKVV